MCVIKLTVTGTDSLSLAEPPRMDGSVDVSGEMIIINRSVRKAERIKNGH